ncbi:Chitinase 4 [Basidiobolus ranarum]|uniref:Chitinase 4 n=1 Tax=Basidiobolus ranarum TaxID=34480 RepID=A0ABR2WGZ3_9FUNG
MNCADIEIKGSTDGYITGPKLLVANLPGYPTIPEFPNDGPDDGRDLLAARPPITIRPVKDTTPTTTSTTPISTSTSKPTSTSTTSTIATTSTTPTFSPNPGLCNGVAAWNDQTAYLESQKVTHKGHLWKAQWWTQSQTPDASSAWFDLGAC